MLVMKDRLEREGRSFDIPIASVAVAVLAREKTRTAKPADRATRSGAISRGQAHVVNRDGAGCHRGLIPRKVNESRMAPTAGHLKITPNRTWKDTESRRAGPATGKPKAHGKALTVATGCENPKSSGR